MPAAMDGQHILILGLGHSGLAMARWCARAGAHVTVADTRAEPPELAVLRGELPAVRFLAGPLSAALLDQAEASALYCSPGLAPAQLAAVAAEAGRRGLPVAGELDLFTAALARLREEHGYHPVLLAVTGTNGKTTVTALTGALVARAGRSVAVAGNIGATLLDTLRERLDAGTLPEVWVLELSSFQLYSAHGFDPHAATLLNLSQDHLDWHGSMQAYAEAKARIFGPHTIAVLNRDDAAVLALGPPQSLPMPAGRARRTALVPAVRTFGTAAPVRAGDLGLQQDGGMDWLVLAEAPDGAPQRTGAEPMPPVLRRLMPADALHIQGRHNAMNALAALALALSCGCALAPMLYGLREYRGEPHRTESVAVIDGVEYFDDSKGTNVGATVAALQGLGVARRLVVILGGDGKGQDFTPLAGPVARFARAVVLIGRDAPLLRAALQNAGVPLEPAHSMAHAIEAARALARPGDAVLLSPACASFDMFRNYEHRAQVFRELVQEQVLAGPAPVEQVS